MKPNTLGSIALIVAIVSLLLNGWLLYDRYKTNTDQQNELRATTLSAALDAMMNTYCQAGGTTSESELVTLAKALPGAEEAKIETEDGVKKIVVGYNTGSGWGDMREALNCSSR